MIDHEELVQSIENKREQYVRVSSQIWDYAETCFQEHRSSKALAGPLGAGGIPGSAKCSGYGDGFCGRKPGSGKPVIGFLGEYDALPGLSQKADA